MSTMDHPSINGSHKMAPTLAAVIDAAEESDAVVAYDTHQDCLIVIDWCDGTSDRFANTVEALNAICEMSVK